MVSETLILGGGLAGSAAAVLLARNGMPVRLLERTSAAHDKVCGEFLSVEAQAHLRDLGLDPVRLGAVPIDRVRLVAGSRMFEAKLPFLAAGLSRKLLDEALLKLAAASGAVIERGVRVSAIAGSDVSTSDGLRHAERILLATGKHDVRGSQRREAEQSGYIGFKMHWRMEAKQRSALERTIELVLVEGGYAGLQPVARDVMNLCLVLKREQFAEAGGTWEGLLARLNSDSWLAWRLAGADPLFTRPLAIAKLPYGYVCEPDPATPEHLFRLGDQAAMTASLTGDGMAVALRSAAIAAEAVHARLPASAFHARLRRAVGGQIKRGMLLQRMTERPAALALGLQLLRLWPGLLGSAAGATRLPGWRKK